MRKNINIDAESVEKAVEACIDHPNAYALKAFFLDLITSENAEEAFVNFYCGKSYPNVPDIGDYGDIAIKTLKDNLWDGESVKAYEDSELVKNDRIRVKVTNYKGIHRYSPLEVELPIIGEDYRNTLSIKLEDFNEEIPF